MTGAIADVSYDPPLEAILEHETKSTHQNRPAAADAPTPPPDTFRRSIHRTIRLWYARAVRPFWKLTMAQILCAIYILILTFSSPPIGLRDPVTNNIIDTSSMANTAAGLIYINGSYRPIVAMTTWQKTCLAISRASAFSMYPMLVVVFVTKMKAIHFFLYTSPLSMYFGILTNAHEFHVYAGRYLAFDVWLHALFHILRWHAQDNMILLWTSRSGLSGIIAIAAITFVPFPMMYCKDKLSYEIRQGFHFLFYVAAIGLCFHVPISAIPNGGYIAPILGTCIVLYALDVCYVYFFMCETIETPSFHVLPSGVQLTFTASDRFQKAAAITRGGYVYINIPWINDKQWHPFSLFEDPTDPTKLKIFLLRNGNWTNSVHKSLAERDTQRPCWIKGPFPSPYTQASLYDNHVLIATGVGITPALATICAYKSSRRIHLIWAVRDNTMLEYFLGHNYFDHNGWTLIYYTGQTKLLALSTIESVSNNTNVRIIYGRPPLPSIIPNIIYGIESKVGRPEQYTIRSKSVMKKILSDYAIELESDDRCFNPTEKHAMICQLGQDFGFTITIQHSTSSNLEINLGNITRTDSPYTLDEQKQQQRNEDEHDLNVTYDEKNYPRLASSVVESLRRVQQSELDVDENELVNDALLEPPAPLVHVDSLPREVVANDPPLSTVSTGGERNTVLLHGKNREVRRLKKELESALSDVIMLTEALESNNEALDAAVLELEERWTRWEREDKGTAACVDEDANAELERLHSELREREFEVTCLQRELEEATKLGDELANTLTLTQAEISSQDRNLSAIVESPLNVETVDLSAVAAEERYDDLQRKFDNLMVDADVLKNDANVARVRIAKLESDLKVREDEIERLRSSNKSATAAAEMVNSTSRNLNPTEEEKLVNNDPQSSSQGGNLDFILANKKPDDYLPTPTPNTVPPLYIRRFSSEIAVENSSSSWAENIEQDYDEVVTHEQFAAMRWDSLRTNLLNRSGSDAAWLVPTFCPWIANEEQERFVKNLDKDVMSTWAVMYCGGSKSVIRDLQGLSIDFNIDVHVDSFTW